VQFFYPVECPQYGHDGALFHQFLIGNRFLASICPAEVHLSKKDAVFCSITMFQWSIIFQIPLHFIAHFSLRLTKEVEILVDSESLTCAEFGDIHEKNLKKLFWALLRNKDIYFFGSTIT
jgi:hypothetical protein